MAESPERDIEKQLRASAEQRRAEAGGPFELHPATRRLLQGEVARRYGKRAGDGTRSARVWWAALWPRLAFGASLAVLLGVGAWIYLSPPRTTKLAMEDQFKTRNSAVESADANRENAEGGAKLMRADRASEALSPANGPLTPVAPDLVISAEKSKGEGDALKGTGSNLLASASELPPETTQAPRATAAASATTLVELPTATSNVPLLAAAAGGSSGEIRRTEPSLLEGQQRMQLDGARQYSNQIVVVLAAAGRGGRGGGGGGRGGTGLAAPAGAGGGQAAGGGAIGGASAGGGGQGGGAAGNGTAAATGADAAPGTGGFGGGRGVGVDPTGANAATGGIAGVDLARAGRAGGGGGRGGGGAGGRGGGRGAFVPLQTFRVEQGSNSLRVVDADGSVYEGATEPWPGDRLAMQTPEIAQRASQQPAAYANAPQFYRQSAQMNFSVAGTNISRAQPVVFSGQVQQFIAGQGFENQNAPTNPARFLDATTTSNQSTPGVSNETLSRIVGRAVVGGTNSFEVDAITTRQ